jgi:hypothetical protein
VADVVPDEPVGAAVPPLPGSAAPPDPEASATAGTNAADASSAAIFAAGRTLTALKDSRSGCQNRPRMGAAVARDSREPSAERWDPSGGKVTLVLGGGAITGGAYGVGAPRARRERSPCCSQGALTVPLGRERDQRLRRVARGVARVTAGGVRRERHHVAQPLHVCARRGFT